MNRWTKAREEDIAADYARWLEDGRLRAQLAAAAGRIFRERGPAMHGRMRLDLEEFLGERSDAELAQFVSLNDDPRDDAEYVASLDADAQRRLGD